MEEALNLSLDRLLDDDDDDISGLTGPSSESTLIVAYKTLLNNILISCIFRPHSRKPPVLRVDGICN